MARLISPQGATVEVRDEKVDALLRMGFTKAESKAPAKKAASKKSGK